ncbi:MAG: hypothetical protein AAGG44_17655, partial [Planctomycetota bacterium]
MLATYVVDSPSDAFDFDLDDGICAIEGGGCSLRAAVQNANRDQNPDIVEFDLNGSFPSGIPSIRTLGIRVDGPIEIRGDSQTGGAVELTGSSPGGTGIELRETPLSNGSVLSSSNSTIRGLVINGFGTGISIASNSNSIYGNRIGTNALGTAAVANSTGVVITGNENQIGDGSPSRRNVISGNTLHGVLVVGSNNSVQGNTIGADATDRLPLGNGGSGVFIGGTSNLVGGGDFGNLIAANQVGITASGDGNQ